MEFLIRHFLQMLDSYRSFLEYSWDYDSITNSYIVNFYNLPPELDVQFVQKKINRPNTDGKCYKDKIAQPIESGNHRYLNIVLDKDTYAEKISFIDMTLRHYLSSSHYSK